MALKDRFSHLRTRRWAAKAAVVLNNPSAGPANRQLDAVRGAVLV
jgi:hypothetical protein